MAPRTLKPDMEKTMKVKFPVKRVKAEMGKIKADQERIGKKQRKIRGKFGEIERQCDQLKEETEMVIKQTARTQIKVALMFKILKAREGGDFNEAAKLTHFLRELVANERDQPQIGKKQASKSI
ncbi:uncharacterized protein LOC111283793 [Durio zibethinus]|uniref:Uncharacterized protein LOC111283793 n=1 Tax=Durio zibethinus TaxID=66656 RepID=A0A6P5XIX1_DURZI|nr:uncharacterized protein LOC111283793 [Durio zibethinus]